MSNVTHLHGLPAQPADHYDTAAAVMRAAGLTYRQLDHWTRAGYLHADTHPGHGPAGRIRGYTLPEARIAKFMALLVDAGLRVDVAAKVARSWVEDGEEMRVGVFVLKLADEVPA